ncbi:MAG: tetratricopeptide repeat protein [SAR324 cluster bacterium]|nr:tetratricopeptide repeat protein [SAR324 cluster bacterium]
MPLKGSYRSEVALGIMLLTFATIVSYSPLNDAQAIFDDITLFLNDPMMTNPEGWWRIWLRPLENNNAWPYLPITRSTFWIEQQLFGFNLSVTHWINVILHLATALLLWIVLQQLSFKSAWFVAMFFALHPIHVQSVAWIAERKNVVSGVFFMLTLWGYASFEKTGKKGIYFLTLGLYLGALLSKTATIMLPFLFIFYRLWRRSSWQKAELGALLPFFLLALFIGPLRVWYELVYSGATDDLYGRSFLERLLIAGKIPFFYLSKITLPFPLMFHYPKWSDELDQAFLYIPLLSIVIVLGILCHKYRSWGRPLILGLMAYGVLLFPVLGFFNNAWTQFSYVADHWVYLPSIIVSILLVSGAHLGIEWIAKRSPAFLTQKTITGVISVVIFSTMASLTWHQTLAYKNLESLSKESIAKNPAAWLAHYNLGIVYEERGETKLALEKFSQAIDFSPRFTDAYEHRGLAHLKLKQYQLATNDFSRAIQLDPKSASFYGNRGLALFQLKQYDEALRDLDTALQLDPNSAEIYNNRGVMLLDLKRFPEAIKDLNNAIELNTGAAKAYINRGLAFHNLLQHKAACLDWQHACRLGECEYLQWAKKNEEC